MAGKQGGDSQAELGRVKGIFNSGLDELDNYLILADIDFTRAFLVGEGADENTQAMTRLAVFLNDSDEMGLWQKKITQQLESGQTPKLTSLNLVALNWQQMMPQLVQFIALDDAGNYIFLVLILIMVVIGIVNTVLMSVLERTREFGLLRALGINQRSLIQLVLCETALLSIIAVLIGWLVGGGIHWWFSEHGIDLSGFIGEGTSMAGTYMDPIVYTELSWQRVQQLTGIIFIATLLTGIYPAIKAARVTPIEAIRT